MEPKTINVHEAKTHFSKLLGRVEQGEEIVIARAGRPVARLSPIRSESTRRVLGGSRGQIWIAEDFDGPLPEDVLSEFER